MQNIPSDWPDPKKATLKDKLKRFTDLKEKDLPIPASVICYQYAGLQATLVSYKESIEGDARKRIQNTGVVFKFSGGRRTIQNKRLLELLMTNSGWNKYFGPDPTDPTEFWRQMGIVKVETVEVVVPTDVMKTGFSELDFKKLKPVEAVTPLLKVEKVDMPVTIGEEAGVE